MIRDGRTWRRLVLDFIPRAKKSRHIARVNPKNGRIIMFPDSRSQKDEKAIKEIAETLQLGKLDLDVGMWEVRVTVWRPLGKREAKGGEWNTRRGDTVSCHESVCDALTGVWWADDSQVVMLTIEEDRSVLAPGMVIEASPR